MSMTVGLDWGAGTHAVCVLDRDGSVATRFDCPHTAVGLAELMARLARIAAPAEMPVAMGAPRASSSRHCSPPVIRWCQFIPTS